MSDGGDHAGAKLGAYLVVSNGAVLGAMLADTGTALLTAAGVVAASSLLLGRVLPLRGLWGPALLSLVWLVVALVEPGLPWFEEGPVPRTEGIEIFYWLILTAGSLIAVGIGGLLAAWAWAGRSD